eukprot:476731-Hanusia_phi.AAC.2
MAVEMLLAARAALLLGLMLAVVLMGLGRIVMMKMERIMMVRGRSAEIGMRSLEVKGMGRIRKGKRRTGICGMGGRARPGAEGAMAGRKRGLAHAEPVEAEHVKEL